MRIACFVPKTSADAAPRVGALLPDETHVLDFAAAIDAGASAPLLSWYDLDGPYLRQALALVRDLGADPLGGSTRLSPGAVVPLADIRLLAPVPRPGKLICIGLNYRDHAAESKLAVPSSPVTFSKYATAVTHPAAPVYLQFADKQWQRGKSCDTFAPMGPAIVTTDDIPDPHALRIRLRLNGTTMQDSSTAQLIFGVDALVAFLSETVTLEP